MARDRRLTWMVRLLLYPAVLALLAFAWHQHRADAALEERNALKIYRGVTGQGRTMSAPVVAGWLKGFVIDVRLTCAGGRPELADTTTTYSQIASVARIDGTSIRGAWTGIPFHWPSGLHGTGSSRLQATLDGSTLRGVVWLDVELAEVMGPLPCHSGPVGFVLRKP
jgi:hypothetical protein